MARTKQRLAKLRKAAAAGGGAPDMKFKSPPKGKKSNVSKHGGKNSNNSLFGPIVQPSRTWKLTDSMGGGSDKSKRSKTRPKRNSNSKKFERSSSSVSNNSNSTVNRPTIRKPFYLNMPVVASNDPVVPWLNHVHKFKGSVNSKYRKVHGSLSLPGYCLGKLDAELEAFAEYVKLNEDEISSRLSVVQKIQSRCQNLFGVSPESCKVFGSFACLPVCTFASDVDLAIHGIITPPTPPSSKVPTKDFAEEEGEAVDKATKRASKRVKVTELHPNQKRQTRVLEWKALFDEAEQKRQVELKSAEDALKVSETAGADDNAKLKKFEAPSNDQPPKVSSKPAPRVELAHSEPLPKSAEETSDGMPLFVIDREGCPGGEDTPTVTDSSREPSISDEDNKGPKSDKANDGNESDDEVVCLNDTVGFQAGTLKAAVAAKKDNYSAAESDDEVICLNDEKEEYAKIPARLRDDDSDSDVAWLIDGGQSDSDVDSADKMGSYHRRNHEAAKRKSDEGDEPLKVGNRPRSRSLISLCSATTCSDTEDKGWDDSGMEVSFVAKKRRGQAIAPDISEETRAKVIRALNALGRQLRKCLPLDQLHVRKKAKVPIINLETSYGYECDIAVGGQTGVDTTEFARSQCDRFRSFPTVVLFLKVLLNQHDLDKPFSGGIGSFKLYVLVASHIEKHLELGGSDHPAEILIAFLFRYGGDGKGYQRQYQTNLSQDSSISTEGLCRSSQGVAEMSSVFQLDNCIRVFQACYSTLRNKLAKPNTYGKHSVLGHLIDAQTLLRNRQKSLRLVPMTRIRTVNTSVASITHPGLPLQWRAGQSAKAEGRDKEAVSKTSTTLASNRSGTPRQREEEAALNTDEEAEQLVAGYSKKTSPKNRSMKASKKGGTKRKEDLI